MNASKRMTALLGGAGTSAAVVALTAGVALAAAAPAPSGATLFMCPDYVNGGYRTTIRGVFPMTQADAVGFLVHVNDGNSAGASGPGGMIYRVAADDGDGWPGDRDIAGSYIFAQGTQTDGDGYLRAGPNGIEYQREISIPSKNFNEDDGVFDDEDEVYAVAMFRDGGGGERWQFSQKVVRHFEAAGICDGCCS